LFNFSFLIEVFILMVRAETDALYGSPLTYETNQNMVDNDAYVTEFSQK